MDIKENINKILLYFITIIICLRTTVLYNNNLFYKLLPIFVCVSFVLLVIDYKKIDKKWLKNNWLILLYFAIRIISISINQNFVLNVKVFVFEVFFWIIVREFFDKKQKTKNNVSKIIIFTNFVLNIISLFLQYIIQKDFSKELFGIYTNPNGMAIFTLISITLYDSMTNKKNKKIMYYFYMIFSIGILLLSKSRATILCFIIFVILKMIVNIKIVSFDCLKKTLFIILNIIIIATVGFSYINKDHSYPTKLEQKINDITTNRYYLWKYSIFSLEKSPLIGIGEKNIGEYRHNCINEEVFESLINQNSRIKMLSLDNNHNGYIQLLVGSGYICYIIVMIILYNKIKQADIHSFYVINCILFLNIFENQFLTTSSLAVYMFFYLLNSHEKNTKLIDKLGEK